MRGAGTGLKGIDNELVLPTTRKDFVTSRNDGLHPIEVQTPRLTMGKCSTTFDYDHGGDIAPMRT